MSSFQAINEVELKPIYTDLGNTLGAYVCDPGEDPMIVMHEKLEVNNTPLTQIVYQALLKFHRALPDVYRLFPIVQYFENLPEEFFQPEIVILGKFKSKSRCFVCQHAPEHIRLIG